MIRTRLLPLLVMLLLLGANVALARQRAHYEDAIVVDRSELIVVAHLIEGTIQYVPHQKAPNQGVSWEFHAVLAITEVLKGTCAENEIPIIIHYGLMPLVGGHFEQDNFKMDYRAGREDYPKDIIEIFDTGNSSFGFSPLVDDAREDNLWFLRKHGATYGSKPGQTMHGIVDPEDLQPLEWKDCFMAYMADDPELAVREYANANSERAERAKNYLDHVEVQRILRITDPADRYDKLLPFFLNRTTWDMKWEAKDGIVSCGTIAGARLKQVFDDPEHAQFRGHIIRMWGDIGYQEAVPLLVDLLEKHDRYWAAQNLEEGWWNNNVGSAETRERSEIYGKVYYVVHTLRTLSDPRAQDVLTSTSNRWRAINFDNPQIVEELSLIHI